MNLADEYFEIAKNKKRGDQEDHPLRDLPTVYRPEFTLVTIWFYYI